MDTVEEPEASAGRQERTWLLEIVTLTSFVVAQPILDVFGKSPETFVFRGAGRLDIVVFALAVIVLPALAVWLPALATRLAGGRVRAGAQVAAIGGLIAVLCVQIFKRSTPFLGWRLLLLSLPVAAVLTLMVVRSRGVRRWLSYAWPAAIAFALIFVLLSPVAKLIRTPPESAAAAGGAARVPVVMLVWDQFPLQTLLDPSGGINEELFPGFAELAEGSTWFRHYTVAEAHTYFSVPTILSGRLITDRTKQALAVDHPNTLFTMLRDTHRMNVVEPVTNLCPEDLCAGTAPSAASPQGSPVAALLRDAAGVWTEISLPIHVTRDVTAQFAEAADPDAAVDREAGRRTSSPFDGFLASIRRERDPTLHYFHTLLPHLPWRRFPSGATYETLRGARDDQPLVREARWRWVDEPWAVQLARQRHILQARYVDALVAELTAHLKREGLWEDALVIVTSDHGIPLQPGRSRAPTQENVHEIYWVPMFLKAPGQQEGAVDDRNVTATDLLPTIADALGTRVPWQVEGTSMLDPSTDRGSEKVIRQLYGDERRPDTFRIGLEEAERRLRAEAFRADVRSADPDILPFLVGPRPDLIGRSIEDLDMGTASGRTATLDLPTRTRAGPEDPLPAFVWGSLEGSRAGEEVLVAAAVNGRIAGVSTTWVQDGVPGRFGVIAPETFVRRGENALALFVLEGDELRPIEVRR